MRELVEGLGLVMPPMSGRGTLVRELKASGEGLEVRENVLGWSPQRDQNR